MSNAARELDRLREMVWELVGELERRNQRLEARNRKFEEALDKIIERTSNTEDYAPVSIEIGMIAREAREG